MIMQKCMASMTTATPRGCTLSWMASAISHGQPLLHLQPAREHVHEARDLGEADHLALRAGRRRGPCRRRAGDGARTCEKHVDVLDHHHLVVGDGEERLVEQRRRVLARSPGSGTAAPSRPAPASSPGPRASGSSPRPARMARTWSRIGASSSAIATRRLLGSAARRAAGARPMRVGILVTAQDRQMASPANGSSQVRSRCAWRRRSKFGLAQASFSALHERVVGHAAPPARRRSPA